MQLRANFSYLDKAARHKTESDSASAMSEDEETAGPSTAEQVTVRFKRAPSDPSKTSLSYKSLQMKSEMEPWIPCVYHTEKSTASEVS